MKSLLLVLATLALPLQAYAQTRFLSSPEEARKVSESIIASAGAGNFSAVLKDLKPLSVIPPTEFAVFEAQFNSQATNLLKQFGAATGHEYVREDRVGTRLIRYQYVVFHEKSALRWNLVFYKAEKGWALSHFHFDGNALSFFPSGS